MWRRSFDLSLMLLAVLGFAATVQAAPTKKAPARPMIVVGGADWCPYCKEVKNRLLNEATLQPLVRQFSVTFVDLDDKSQAAMMIQKFNLPKVTMPTVVLAKPDGSVIWVGYGSPQGDALQRMLENALTVSGASGGVPSAGTKVAKRAKKKDSPEGAGAQGTDDKTAKEKKSPVDDERITALHEARKLVRLGKIAEAVAAVAPFEEAKKADSLSTLISTLEKEGHKSVDSAREQLEKPDHTLVAALGLLKARRIYGELSAVREEVQSGLDKVKATKDGKDILRQAEAIDRGRALDEAGQKDSAVQTYRQIVANFANTQAAAMASMRIKQLEQ